MKSAIGYVRVSTDGQVADGVSLEAQKAKISAWCLVHDFQLIDIHVDAGISGSKASNRPGLQSAIDQACQTQSALIVYSLSRLARSTRDTIDISEKLDRSGADLVSLSEKIDTSHAAGKMVFRMLAVLAEFEKDQISERTKMALAHKKAKGERCGSIPFGYIVAEDGKLVECPEELAVISKMQTLRAQGLSYRDIATELELSGIKTKKGNTKWQHTAVKSILTLSKPLEPQLQEAA